MLIALNIKTELRSCLSNNNTCCLSYSHSPSAELRYPIYDRDFSYSMPWSVTKAGRVCNGTALIHGGMSTFDPTSDHNRLPISLRVVWQKDDRSIPDLYTSNILYCSTGLLKCIRMSLISFTHVRVVCEPGLTYFSVSHVNYSCVNICLHWFIAAFCQPLYSSA